MRALPLAFALAFALALPMHPLALSAATLAHAGGSLAVPAGAVSGGNEPAIAVLASGRVLVGDTSGLHRTDNAGASWTTASDPEVPGLFTDGWPIAVDSAGTVYSGTTNGQLISVSASHDGGATWSSTNVASAASVIADRPWISARGAGEIALLWNSAENGEDCAWSTDGGATWSLHQVAGTGPANAGNVVIDAAGRIWYATGNQGSSGPDTGVGAGTAVTGIYRWGAGCAQPLRYQTLPPSGPQIFTQLAMNAAGDVFVAQPTPGNGAMELRALHGLTQSSYRSLVVSQAAQRSNTFGGIAARPDADEVAIAWYGSSSAGDPSASTFSGSWNLYLARVTGFWTATPSITVTTVATGIHNGYFCMGGVSCTGGRNLGDYLGVAYDAAGNVHIAYGKDTGATQVLYAKVAHL